MKALVNAPVIPMTVEEPMRHGRLGGRGSSAMLISLLGESHFAELLFAIETFPTFSFKKKCRVAPAQAALVWNAKSLSQRETKSGQVRGS